ncbi:MAG: hypothetical protein U1G05_11865 [Kiritimatiellia bacterium]
MKRGPPRRIENNRWYDIRVETAGGRLKCFLTGARSTTPPPQMRSFFASATTDETRGEIILKVVNGAYEAQPADIRIEGARIPDGPAASPWS